MCFFSLLFSVMLFAIAGACNLLAADEHSDTNVLVAVYPAPVYSVKNIPELYYNKKGEPRLKLDRLEHLRELEYIALPQTRFEVLGCEKVNNTVIYQVRTRDYPVEGELYVDARFVRECAADQPERIQVLPAKDKIIAAMLGMVGYPYRWGGNYCQGVEQVEEFYPLGSFQLTAQQLQAWKLEGVDCSGLLYQAAAGATPRNTSQLVDYGCGVQIAGKSVAEICRLVKPLDMIVWAGHVIFVLDSKNVIESRPRYQDGVKGGVRVHSLEKVLAEIMQKRTPVDDYHAEEVKSRKRFVVRRFD